MIDLDELDRMLDAGDRFGHATSPAVVRELIAEVRTLLARLEIDPSHSADGIDARDATIRGLEADAARYQWLRSAGRREALHMTGPTAGCWIDSENEHGVLVLLTEEDADAAVDAARAAHPKEGL